jgi:hypothetical protein
LYVLKRSEQINKSGLSVYKSRSKVIEMRNMRVKFPKCLANITVMGILLLWIFPQISKIDTIAALSSQPITVSDPASINENDVASIQSNVPPPNFKVAFIGDSSIRSDTRDVFRLIKAEGADMIIHQGDIDNNEDGTDSPQIFDQMINDILGENFPFFVVIGNHDTGTWDDADGFQELFEARLARIDGAECVGEYGVMAACTYNGISFIQSGVGILGGSGAEHAAFIQEQFAQDDHIWRICSWHKQMNKMQVGVKGDSTGWEVYEACREAGAFIANGHEHSYARTYLMDSFENQIIANTSRTLELQAGKSFVFHAGLGGCSIRNQDQEWPWFDAVYTSDQGADFGALFCTFNVDGQADHASCYFKDVDDAVPDEFDLISRLQGGPTSSFEDVGADHWALEYIEALYQNGYVAGCSEDPLRYCPDNTMTRAESAVFVERGIWSADYIPPQPTEQIFADVPLAEWFAKWTTGLWNDGYTDGCGTDPLIYCPLQEHTMAEGAVFYLRMLNGPDFEPPDPTGIFQDVSLTEWYARWVEAAYNAGIYPACQTEPELLACPEGPLTRAMGAYMMVMAKGIPLE